MNNSGMRDELYYALNEDQRDALRKPIQEESIMCNCIEMINTALEETNTVLDVPIVLNVQTGKYRPPMVRIGVCKRGSSKREKAMPIFPKHCPFCGEKYPDE